MHTSINKAMKMKLHNLIQSSQSALMIGIMLGGLPVWVDANPTGAEVINGRVTFSQPDANSLHVTNSNGSVINWQEFSIGTNETTHFQQTGANSAVLNQVVGSNGSEILGNLTSNGQVYLINQQGIVFGENAVVNTAGFIASTLHLSNQDFIEGRLNFEGNNAGDIINQGYITAGADGDIALIAPNIINQGVISVEQGDVILAAGEKLTLTSLQASDVGFEIQSADNSVVNLGSVSTDGGAVGMFAGSLTHSGMIQANALTLDADGNVMLVAKNDLTITENAVVSADGDNGGRVLIQSENGTTLVSGDVSANGVNGAGGVIDVLGYQVGVIDNAILDASGTTAGGQIHVGGNYQGIGELQNANATFVGLDATIQANAIDTGNGGDIIVWADDVARVHGAISATGGLQSGNGGFVETSGKQFLDVSHIQLDVTAANGQAGSWLLDPTNLTISVNADNAVSAAPIFSSTGAASNLNVDTLLTQLDNGVSVEIDTGITGADTGNITVDAAIAVSSLTAVNLTLDAANDIIINQSITATGGALNLTLNADSGKHDAIDNVGLIQINNSISTAGGSVTMTAGEAISINSGGSIDTAGGNISASTSATTGIFNFFQDPGVFAINAGQGDVVLNVASVAETSINAVDIVANTLSFNTTDGFGDAANPIQTSINSLTYASNNSLGGIYLSNNKALSVISIDLFAGNGINIYNAGDLSVGVINAGGVDVLLDTSIASNAGFGGDILNSGLGTHNIDNALNVNLVAETGIGTAADSLNISNTASLLSASVVSGGIYLDNIGSSASAFNLAALTSNGGDIFVTNLNANSETVILADWSTPSGNINIASQGIVNVNAALTTGTGSASISSVNSDIVFGSTGNISAATVNLTAAGAITDGGVGVNTIGGGNIVDQFAALAGNGISLTATGNDVINLSLVSSAGDITYVDVNDVNLLAAFATADGTSTGAVTGNVSLTAGGAIFKTTGSAINIAASNATLAAVNGIGGNSAIETSITNSLNFTNTTEGSVDLINQSANALQVQGANSTANTSGVDYTQILNPNGSLTIAAAQAITSADANILLGGSVINIDGTVSTVTANTTLEATEINITGLGLVSAVGVADVYAIGLKADEVDLAGAIDAGVGDVTIETLTDGTDIYLASSIDNVGMDISQAEINTITAGRLSIGTQGATASLGTNQIVFDGAIDTAAMATRFINGGNIVFNQGSAVAISNTSAAGVELNTLSEIIDQSAGVDVQASKLLISAANGIGSTAEAIDTQVAAISAVNLTANDIIIFNTGDVTVEASSNFGGNISITSDAALSVSAGAGATGVTGVSATGNIELVAATGLSIGGTLTADTINLSSAESVSVSNNISATSDLIIQADTDTDGVGDVVFDNINAAVLDVAAANLDFSGNAVLLQATAGAVHVETAGSLTVDAATDLSISGGNIIDADAYLSAQGDINLNVAGNLSLVGGTAVNTAASIFDSSAANTNLLAAQIGGDVILTGGAGDNSAAKITAGEISLMVLGNVDLTGSAAANSGAVIEAATGSMLVELPSGGVVTRTAGAGVGSIADLVAALGVTILDGEIVNTASAEVINVPLENIISSNDSLIAELEDDSAVEENTESENNTGGKVLACR